METSNFEQKPLHHLLSFQPSTPQSSPTQDVHSVWITPM